MSLNRRTFLQSAAAAVTCPTLLSAKQNGPDGCIFAFGAYGMKALSLDDAIRTVAEIGYDGIELTIFPGFPAEPPKLSTTDRIAIRRLLTEKQLKLTSLMESVYPSKDSAKKRAALDRIKRAVELARDLADRPPLVQTTLGGGEWVQGKRLVIDTIGRWSEIAADADVVLAVKPHRGSVLAMPGEAVELFEALGRPKYLRMAYDYSHYQYGPLSLEETIDVSLPYTALVVLKDVAIEGNRHRFLLPGETGTVDYPTLLRRFYRGGYRGGVCCEVSGMVWKNPGYDPKEAAATCYANIAPAFKKADVPRS